jgi:hypothetical protein
VSGTPARLSFFWCRAITTPLSLLEGKEEIFLKLPEATLTRCTEVWRASVGLPHGAFHRGGVGGIPLVAGALGPSVCGDVFPSREVHMSGFVHP